MKRNLLALIVLVAALCTSVGFSCGPSSSFAPAFEQTEDAGLASVPVRPRVWWQHEALAVVPFGAVFGNGSDPTVYAIVSTGQSLGLGQNSFAVNTSAIMSNVMMVNSQCRNWNPATVYPKGTVICPRDPLDAGLFVEDASTNPCTASATEPTWARATIGAVAADNTCSWINIGYGGDASVPYQWLDPDASTLSLVPMLEPEREIGTGFAYPNNLTGGEPLTGAMLRMLAVTRGGVWAPHTVGQVGQKRTVIAKGGTGNAYQASINEIVAYHRHLVRDYVGAGYGYKVAGVVLTHGEADATTDTVAQYASYLLQAQSDYQTDAFAETGQAGTLYLYATQQASIGSGVLIIGSTAQAVLERAIAFGSKIVFVGPRYQYEYTGDLTHMREAGYMRMGDKNAEAINQTLNGSVWTGLVPSQISVAGANITITYAGGIGALQFDPNMPDWHMSGTYSDAGQGGSLLGWNGSRCHGFEIFKAAGTVQGCVSATISGNQVILVANSTDIGKVGYAAVADATAPIAGAQIRGGTLCDHDAFVGSTQPQFTVGTTSGSPTITCSTVGNCDHLTGLWDLISGSGIPANTVIKDKSGGTGTMTMSANATATASVTATITRNQANYAAMFQAQTGDPSACTATDFQAATASMVSRIHCTGFIGATTAGSSIPKVWIANSGGGSVITELTVTYISSTVLEVSGIPSLAGGSYDLQLQNPFGSIVTFTNAFTSQSTDTMASIWGLSLRGNGTPADVVGSPATAWNDRAGFACNLSAFAGSTGLTVNASDANFNNKKTVTGNGTNDDMQCLSFPGATSATDGIMMILAARLLSTTAARVLIQYGGNQQEFQRNGGNAKFIAGSSPNVTWTGTDPLNTTAAWYGFDPGGTGTQSASISINNGTFVAGTGASRSNTTTSSTLSVFSRASASIPTNVAIAEWAFIGYPAGTTVASLASKLTRTQTMFHTNYGLTVSPSGALIVWQPWAMGLGLVAAALRRRRSENDNARREGKRAA